MNIDVFSYTNEGARDLNEDCHAVQNDENKLIAVLCDGLGGHNCGEIASRTAVKNIMEGLKIAPEIQNETVNGILKFVNDGITKYQSENPEYKGMRTTAVGCVAENNKLTYFNSGDSRFYYFSNGAVSAMSKDHSVSQMSVDLGEMPYDKIRFDADRNKLLKVLGDNSGSGEIGTVYNPIEMKRGDAFLLCSDGFWEYVLEEEMEIDLSKSATAKEWVEFMLVRLLLKFSKNNDNFTVIAGIIN